MRLKNGAKLALSPEESVAIKADQALAQGTTLYVEGYGEGVYVGCEKTWIGSNNHSVTFPDSVSAQVLPLRDLLWTAKPSTVLWARTERIECDEAETGERTRLTAAIRFACENPKRQTSLNLNITAAPESTCALDLSELKRLPLVGAKILSMALMAQVTYLRDVPEGYQLAFAEFTKIDLYGCELGDIAMETLAPGILDAFPSGGKLKVVDFTSNCLSDVGVSVLVSALPTTVVELHLDYNRCGDVGLSVLMSKAVAWPELKILCLNHNAVTDVGFADLSRELQLYAAQPHSPSAALSLFAQLPALELRVANNETGEEARAAVRDAAAESGASVDVGDV